MPRNNDPGNWESRYRQQLKLNLGSIGIIMEGDSWFAFPNLLRTNIYLALDQINGPNASIWSLAHSGDTADEITKGEQFQLLRRIFSDVTLPTDAFMFSAGGNDIVGNNLLSLVHEYQEGMQWMDCIDTTYLDQKLQDIRAAYRRLIDLRDAFKPQTYFFTHSYDFAQSSGKEVMLLWLPIAGGWLKEKFEIRGVKDGDMQSQIIAYLLKEFAMLLDEFERTENRFVHVQTQGTLNPKIDWKDELHPTVAGFNKVAAKFQNALRTCFPSLPRPTTAEAKRNLAALASK
jgi:hypothetical protein